VNFGEPPFHSNWPPLGARDSRRSRLRIPLVGVGSPPPVRSVSVRLPGALWAQIPRSSSSWVSVSLDVRSVIPETHQACGTNWHAGLVGVQLLKEFAHIPTEVECASEFRYRNAPIEKNTLLAITQSSETADTRIEGPRSSCASPA